MTFQDIFKSSFLENIASVSIFDMVLAMVLAFALGMFIFLIYKRHLQVSCTPPALVSPWWL